MLFVTMKDVPLTPAALATRERIIENAETLFRKYGRLKTTIDDIAQLSGMSHANVYKFFSSKDDLIEIIGERSFARLKSDVTKIGRSKGSTWHKIELMILKYHRMLRREMENEAHILELAISVREKGLRFVENFDNFFVANMTQILEQGIATNEFRPLDPAITAQAIMDCVLFATRAQFIGDLPAKEHERRLIAQLSLLAHAVKQ